MTQLSAQLDYLTHLERFETVKPGLDNMRRLLTALKNPETKFPTIHIAGTNGKSSTAAIMASILNRAGIRTGLYTSPHLKKFNERVQINGHPINNLNLAGHIKKIRSVATSSKTKPTFFEFTTALAFRHFAEKQIDIAIVEVGMGGDLDATNVITPLLSIITNVGTDHQTWLGKTKQAIAKRKAGIIKPTVPVITAETNPQILDIFTQIADQNSAPLIQTSQLLKATQVSSLNGTQTFSTSGIFSDSFSLSLRGQHQITNALTALTAIHHLQATLPVTIDQIKAGLAQVKWPGRLDLISKDPYILTDGAHNKEGFQSLIKYLKYSPLPSPEILILGLKKDKQMDPEIEQLIKLFKHVIVTEANYQPMPAEKLAKHINSYHDSTEALPKVADAIAKAQKKLTPGSMLLITGSLYLVGDTLSILEKKPQ